MRGTQNTTRKTDLTVFTAWAARARFGVRPEIGGTPATGIANEEGGEDIASSSDRGGEDDDMMIDDGGDFGGDDADGNSGGIDVEVDAGGTVGESRIGAASGLAGGDDEGFGKGGLAHHHEDDMSSAGDGSPSLEGVEVEGNDPGYESIESWAGTREDVGAGVDTEDDEDRGSSGDERNDDDDDDGAGRDGKDHAGAGHSMDTAAPHKQASISERSSGGGSSSGAEHGQPPPQDDPRWMSNINRVFARLRAEFPIESENQKKSKFGSRRLPSFLGKQGTGSSKKRRKLKLSSAASRAYACHCDRLQQRGATNVARFPQIGYSCPKLFQGAVTWRGTRAQEWRPFKSLTEILLFVFGVKHQLSRTGMTDLFDILTFVDGQPGDGAGEGRGFDTADVPEIGQKFVSRMPEFLPLFEVWVRDVVAKPDKKKSGARTTAKVYDIPITQVLDFMLKSRSHMEEIFANPGGAVVGKEEGQKLGLAGEHLFPLPTRPARNARRNNMHGTLVQRIPQHNFDDFLAQARTKVYVGDVVMCDLRDEGSPDSLQTPCRITATFFVEKSRRLVVTVRLFRDAHEVLGVAHDDPAFVQDGVVRVWEQVGDASETDLRDITQVLDRVEVNVTQVLDQVEDFTRAELRDGAHLRPWIGAGTRREGWTFVGEGFVTRRGHRFVRRRDPFKEGGWRREGSEEENYPDIRSADVCGVGACAMLSRSRALVESV
ncbi:unnamed protein product [Ectocarpus sp. CCAP 1310/34]|nr:unnamed protein product [Ectocarpus sp. CCAP 1310/34]